MPSCVRPDTAALTRDLNVARACWQNAGTPNYTSTGQSTGFVPAEPITVTVRGGVVTATAPADRPGLGTVKDMHDVIAR
ncbi:hypothetical protein HNQ07_003666 [Deinococcus metalli]|uniref:Uncharacterized protein n=1 Tax=Deinococcus metalli TaxID=1141878 RepID=A0A7W8KHU0_9DEIO|nr:hypothetical protein [Deinococcus metalli]GHF56519.1 hypothetical protein GCM10017781_36040 [Deinococcus metalli]